MACDIDIETLVARHSRTGTHVAVVDDSLTIRALSASLGALTAPGVVGANALELIHPDDQERAIEVTAEVLSHLGARPPGVYRLRLGDGIYRAFDVAAHNYGVGSGGAIVYEIREVDERRRAESLANDQVEIMEMMVAGRSLEDCLRRLTALAERQVDGAAVAIAVFGEGEALVVAGSDVPDERLAVHRRASRADHPRLAGEAFDLRISRFGAAPSAERFSLQVAEPAQGGGRPFRSAVTTPIISATGDPVGYVEAVRPDDTVPSSAEWAVHALIGRLAALIVERFEFAERLRRAASHDALTGLANRRHLDEQLSTIAATAQAAVVAVVDLDRFAWINNTQGHHAGDRILCDVARRLVAAAGPAAVVARPGGDEFVVCTTEHIDPAALGDLLHRALRAATPPIQASIGVASVPGGTPADEALVAADKAMYVAKRAGGDGFHAVAPGGADANAGVAGLEADLRRAVAGDALHLAFQPVYALGSRRVAGVEALVRWDDPRRGIVRPEQFIEVAEGSDLIVDLDRWVVRRAIEEFATWLDAGVIPSTATLWVNLSPRTVTVGGVAAMLAAARAGRRDVRLGIEIAEAAYGQDPRRFDEVLGEVRAGGDGVAIDDVGTGLLSLHQLADAPTTAMKLHGGLLDRAARSRAHRSMVESLVSLARDLGGDVVAEAIETADQLRLVAALGCTLGQGNLLAPPLTAARLVEHLAGAAAPSQPRPVG